MIQFANVFPDEKIVVSLIRQLRWGYLEKYEMVEGENQPIGLILCSGKNADNEKCASIWFFVNFGESLSFTGDDHSFSE